MGFRIPSLTAKKLVRFLKKHGFKKDRQRGSHLTLVNVFSHETITIPVHTGPDIGKGLLKKILSDAGFTIEEFNRLR